MLKAMVVYIPGLRSMIRNKKTVIYEKMGGDWPEEVPGVPEMWTLSLLEVSFTSAYFDSITVDSASERMTFRREQGEDFPMGEAVRAALGELDIHGFKPCSLSYWALAPGWQPPEGTP